MSKFTTNVQLDGAVVSFESETAEDVLQTVAKLRKERERAIVANAVAAAEQERVDADTAAGSPTEPPTLTVSDGGKAKPRAKRTDQKKGAGAETVAPQPLAAPAPVALPAEGEVVTQGTLRAALMALGRTAGQGAPAIMEIVRSFTAVNGSECVKWDEIQPKDFSAAMALIVKRLPQ